MELKEIFSVLENQVKDLNNLLDAAINKQNAIISYDPEKIEEAVVKEEKAISKVQQSEKLRLNVIEEIYKTINVKNASFKLKEFSVHAQSHFNKKQLAFISNCEAAIKELSIQITVINQQNLHLIENSRAFLNETIKVVANSNKAILDRRV